MTSRLRASAVAIGWACILSSLMLSSSSPTKDFAPVALRTECMYAAVCICGAIISWSKDRVRSSISTLIAASAGGAMIYGLVLALPGIGNPLRDLVYSTALLQTGFLMFITVLTGMIGFVWGWIARSLLSNWLSPP